MQTHDTLNRPLRTEAQAKADLIRHMASYDPLSYVAHAQLDEPSRLRDLATSLEIIYGRLDMTTDRLDATTDAQDPIASAMDHLDEAMNYLRRAAGEVE